MSTVRVALIGDQGVGKTSLILAAAQKTVTGDTPAPTLMPTRLELAWNNFHATCICHDTNSDSAEEIVSTVRKCDVVLICFAMDNPVTLRNAINTWIPLSNSANDQLPIMLVGCKDDISVMTPGHPTVRPLTVSVGIAMLISAQDITTSTK
jgi:GTPase SAR1 family protein